MSEYILFIDTETSDKPRAWKSPTYQTDKWPYLLQVSWTLCRKDGECLFTRDFYINPGEINIHEDSLQIHGITLDFLKENGIPRKKVLQHLTNDLQKYNPLVVGHFIQFDVKMLEVGFNRTQIAHNLSNLPKFCTMINTRNKLAGADAPMMRLGPLYESLFRKELLNQHNAKVDALATKDCFFELVKRGKINDRVIDRQQRYFKPRVKLRSVLLNLLS